MRIFQYQVNKKIDENTIILSKPLQEESIIAALARKKYIQQKDIFEVCKLL